MCRFPRILLLVALLAPDAATGAGVNLLTNGSFEDTGGQTSSFRVKDSNGTGQFLLPGWTIQLYPNFPLDCLMYAGQTTALCNNLGGKQNSLNPSGVWQFYTYPGASPDGGNFLGVDGDPKYSAAISQTITGLTIGQGYTVNFYQAAAQQAGFSGATTEAWQVTFGGDVQTSVTMNTPDQGTTPWNLQTLYFFASSASQTLTFLAQGAPQGDPPITLLDGVSLTSGTPEPAAWSLAAIGVGFLIATRLRR